MQIMSVIGISPFRIFIYQRGAERGFFMLAFLKLLCLFIWLTMMVALIVGSHLVEERKEKKVKGQNVKKISCETE